MIKETKKILFVPSNQSFQAMDKEDIVSAALRSKIGVSYSCRNGNCGACMGRIVEGQIAVMEHIDPDSPPLGSMVRLCQVEALSDLVVEVKEVPYRDPLSIQTITAEVVKVDRPSNSIVVLGIKIPAKESFEYLPGQYINILLDDGDIRSYSIANLFHVDGFIELHIQVLPGGLFSDSVLSKICLGDTLIFEGPFGDTVWQSRADVPVLLIANGTGIAPVFAMLQQKLPIVSHSINLYWAVKDYADFYLLDQLNTLENQYQNFRFIPVVMNPYQNEDFKGRYGFVQNIIVQDESNLSAHDVYACGSPSMIEAVRNKLVNELNLQSDRFFADAFVPAASLAPLGSEIHVEFLSPLVPTRTLVGQSGETLLQLLRRNGLPVLSACGGKAACGTCKIEIAPVDWPLLPAAEKNETELLTYLPDVGQFSRLSCQVKLTEDISGLRISL